MIAAIVVVALVLISVGGIGLHLRGEVREIWFDWLRQYRPDLVPRYEELFANGAYMRTDERERLTKLSRGRSRPRRFIVERQAEREAGVAGSEPAPAAQPRLF